jgi:dienelactone hydrolase
MSMSVRIERWVLVASLAAAGCPAEVAQNDAMTELDATSAMDATSGGAGDAFVGGDPCARGETCDGTTGLCESSRLCSEANPCMNALVGLERRTVTEPLTLPTCRTTRAGRPIFDDGPPRTWTTDGITRAACVYTPPSATTATPRPLVVYLHGSGGNAAAIYDSASLRSKAETFDLAGDGIAGFVLAAHQGRNQENENGNPPASRHDVYFRGFEGSVANADARSLDTMIDDLVATGTVDPTRIYVTGWSNGAFFGQEYALFRRRTPTPGGHRIAAVVAFDGGDPFQTPRRDLVGCELVVPPRRAAARDADPPRVQHRRMRRRAERSARAPAWLRRHGVGRAPRRRARRDGRGPGDRRRRDHR